MSKLILSAILYLGLASLVASLSNVEWVKFKSSNGKSYESQREDRMRKSIFTRNKRYVEQFNANQSDKLGYKLGINHMSDWTQEEKRQLNGFRISLSSRRLHSADGESYLKTILNRSTEVPEKLDWREVPGRVTPVKNQGSGCGSCWAFATTGVLEGQEISRNSSSNDKLIGLSEQNLVDCDTFDQGCNGGDMFQALMFIKLEGGIDDEKSYPYKSENGDSFKCHFQANKVAMSDRGAFSLPEGDEKILKEVVAKFGPVAIGMDASELSSYESGVYNNPNCSSDDLDHGVLIIGYGNDEKFGDYWIVKNSWGQSWGEDGYFKLARNKNNLCGVATAATVPVV